MIPKVKRRPPDGFSLTFSQCIRIPGGVNPPSPLGPAWIICTLLDHSNIVL